MFHNQTVLCSLLQKRQCFLNRRPTQTASKSGKKDEERAQSGTKARAKTILVETRGKTKCGMTMVHRDPDKRAGV